jgi:hypothetical protein
MVQTVYHQTSWWVDLSSGLSPPGRPWFQVSIPVLGGHVGHVWFLFSPQPGGVLLQHLAEFASSSLQMSQLLHFGHLVGYPVPSMGVAQC